MELKTNFSASIVELISRYVNNSVLLAFKAQIILIGFLVFFVTTLRKDMFNQGVGLLFLSLIMLVIMFCVNHGMNRKTRNYRYMESIGAVILALSLTVLFIFTSAFIVIGIEYHETGLLILPFLLTFMFQLAVLLSCQCHGRQSMILITGRKIILPRETKKVYLYKPIVRLMEEMEEPFYPKDGKKGHIAKIKIPGFSDYLKRDNGSTDLNVYPLRNYRSFVQKFIYRWQRKGSPKFEDSYDLNVAGVPIKVSICFTEG